MTRGMAFLAALLHDYAKYLPEEETRTYCEKYEVVLDEVVAARMELAHSFLGAEIARREFGITDENVLNAIRYHTTGRANMSFLEKIIYLADCIEPNRDYYPGLKEIRQLAYQNIDDAMEIALKRTIAYNESRGRVVHPLSREALAAIKGGKNE